MQGFASALKAMLFAPSISHLEDKINASKKASRRMRTQRPNTNAARRSWRRRKRRGRKRWKSCSRRGKCGKKIGCSSS